MISDPYKVLGVTPSASNDEIKKAYRDLSRKYHPDNMVNNPLADLAEEKFKEVQEAYKMIMDMRENPSGYGNSGYGNSSYGNSSYGSRGFGGAGSSYSNMSSEDAQRFNAVRNYINSGNYNQAITALMGISNQRGEWHYLYAVASLGLRNNAEALKHAELAARMEPNNQEYVNLYRSLQMRGQSYYQGGMYAGRPGVDAGNLCCDIICLDSCCECMGGDLCACI